MARPGSSKQRIWKEPITIDLDAWWADAKDKPKAAEMQDGSSFPLARWRTVGRSSAPKPPDSVKDLARAGARRRGPERDVLADRHPALPRGGVLRASAVQRAARTDRAARAAERAPPAGWTPGCPLGRYAARRHDVQRCQELPVLDRRPGRDGRAYPGPRRAG